MTWSVSTKARLAPTGSQVVPVTMCLVALALCPCLIYVVHAGISTPLAFFMAALVVLLFSFAAAAWRSSHGAADLALNPERNPPPTAITVSGAGGTALQVSIDRDAISKNDLATLLLRLLNQPHFVAPSGRIEDPSDLSTVTRFTEEQRIELMQTVAVKIEESSHELREQIERIRAKRPSALREQLSARDRPPIGSVPPGLQT